MIISLATLPFLLFRKRMDWSTSSYLGQRIIQLLCLALKTSNYISRIRFLFNSFVPHDMEMHWPHFMGENGLSKGFSCLLNTNIIFFNLVTEISQCCDKQGRLDNFEVCITNLFNWHEGKAFDFREGKSKHWVLI